MFDWVAVVETGRKAAGLDPALAGDDELFEAALALEQLRALVDVAEGHVLAELDVRGATVTEFGLRTGSWLARDAHLPAAVAGRRVKVAGKLRSLLPVVDEALAAGRISFDHARVLADACNPRIAAQVAAMQTELLALADRTGFERWRLEVLGIVALLDEDGAHDPNEDLARNTLTVTPTFDGLTHLTGTWSVSTR